MTLLQTPLPGAQEVREALDRVYQRPEFAPPARSPVQDALRALWRWVRQALDFLLPDFDGGVARDNVLYVVLIVLMAAVGVFMVLHLTGVLPRLLSRSAEAAAADGRGRGGGGRPSRAAEWEERARKAAAAGRWRDASLALYQALLLRLEERGAVRYDPSKTPGDYRREARKSQEARAVLDGYLRAFEPVAFGGRALDAQGYDGLKSTAGRAGVRG